MTCTLPTLLILILFKLYALELDNPFWIELIVG